MLHMVPPGNMANYGITIHTISLLTENVYKIAENPFIT